MQAMILAAGFGTRLLPHTLVRPKPLFPLLNTPLLLLTIDRLQNQGFDHILVNCHHLGDQIVTALGNREGVTVIYEQEILGTGGGLRNALPFMREEPLLITNGDIYHTVSFRQLYRHHIGHDDSVTLAMHDYQRFNTVCVSGDRVADFQKGDKGTTLAFTGLHVIEPSILSGIPHGRESCIISLYKQLLMQEVVLRVVRVDECFWTDMGTPEDYLALHGGLLMGEVPVWDEIGPIADSICVSLDADLSGNNVFRDWCSVGKAIGENLVVARSVIWDDVRLADNCTYNDMLISKSVGSDNR